MRKCGFWRPSLSMTFLIDFPEDPSATKKIRFSLYRTMAIICAAGLKKINKLSRNAWQSTNITRLFMRSTGWFGLTGEIEINLKLRRKRRFPVESNFVYSKHSRMSVLDLTLSRIPFFYFLGQFKMMKLNKLALWSIWSLNLKTAKFTEITNMSTELNFFILTSLITFNSHALSS